MNLLKYLLYLLLVFVLSFLNRRFCVRLSEKLKSIEMNLYKLKLLFFQRCNYVYGSLLIEASFGDQAVTI